MAEALRIREEKCAQFEKEYQKACEDLQKREEELRQREAACTLISVQGDSAGAKNVQIEAPNTTVIRNNNAAIGRVSEFSLEEDWSQWYERLEFYFLANDIDSERRPAVFLTLLGKDGYALLKNLLAPTRPVEVTLETMVSALKNHLQPATSVIAERFKFKECRQTSGQSVRAYVSVLKKASHYCEFGASLDSSLRDQFVWGLLGEGIKKKLLSESKLSFARAVELAQSQEAAAQHAAEMEKKNESINRVTSQKKPFSKKNFQQRGQGQRGNQQQQQDHRGQQQQRSSEGK